VFLQPVHDDPARPAVFEPRSRRWTSHAELRGEADALARHLAAARGGLAFLLSRNTFGALAGYLACVEAGCAVAILDARTNPEATRQLVDLYLPDLILAADEAPRGELYERERGDFPLSVWWARSPASARVHPDLAVLLSTSGSTGSPKFVRLTRRNVEANADSIRLSLDIRADERAMANLPMHYSYGLSIVNSHLLSGASFVLTDESVMSPAFLPLLREQGCTSMAGVPYTYQMLARMSFDEEEVASLRTMTQAGGKLGEDLVARFHRSMVRRGGRFFVMYGATEATARIACLPCDRLPEKLGAAGQAIPNGRLEIDPGEGAPPTREPHVRGEVVYAGPNVMMGYSTCRADLEKGDELGGVLRTGDLGYLDEEGFLYVTGRSKRIGKVFGLRINLDEVEAKLRPNGPTAVIAGDDRLVVFCEWGDPPRFERLANELTRAFNLTPRAFEFRRIQALPLNANGKIDYQALTSS